jgi:hypothetical protein
MSARFRVRTAQGQELSFASREVFAEFVRSGDLAPDDVVYDAATREWSSALTHPVVLQIQLEAGEESESEEEQGAAEDAHAAGAELPGAPAEHETPTEAQQAPGEEQEAPTEEDGSPGEPVVAPDIGLDLAPPPESLTPEEEAAAFVAKMKAERATNRALGEGPPANSLTVDASSSTLGAMAGSGGGADPSEPRGSEGSRRASAARASRKEKPEPPKRKKPKSTGGRRLAPFVILGLALVTAAVYLGPDLFSGSGQTAAVDTVSVPEPPPLIPPTEEALRKRAQERFLTSTQALLRGLEPIPDIWLHGQYLASPSDYPHVREVWESYLTTIQQVREGDADRYRAAYLRALDDARIQGSARTLRLAAAISDFRADSLGRTTYYDRVEALATAAIRGHDALVGAEGTISYEPALGPRVSADPVIEAVGRNPDAQALLDQVLDMILGQLHADGGPGESRNVREWVWDGFLEAVTS